MSKTPYPISTLADSNGVNISSLIELVVDDYGNNSYINKKVTYEALGDYLISSHAIFNKIDDVYNDKTVEKINIETGNIEYPHHNDIYFAGQTYFKNNPKSRNYDALSFSQLASNQTVRKDQLENMIHSNMLEIRAVEDEYIYKQNVVRGAYKTLEPPIYDESSFRPFYAPSNKCYFKTPLFNGKLFATSAIRLPDEGNFVTIVGKVSLPRELVSDVTTPYYTKELKLWAGVLYINNLIAVTELHNIDNNRIAYFAFQIPSSRDKLNGIQRVRIVVPFQPSDIVPDNVKESRDLLQNIDINSVAVFYYTV